MIDGIVGIIVCFSGPRVPRGWALCDGQEFQMTKHKELFDVLGYRYGGVPNVTFRVPDLRGRTVVSVGQSAFHNYKLGETAGSASLLTVSMELMPAHTHNGFIPFELPASLNPGIDTVANNGYPSEFTGAYAKNGDKYMAEPAYDINIRQAGEGVPVDTRSAFLVLRYIICIDGDVPSRT